MLFELIQQNFVATALTLFLILFILTNNNFESRVNHLFLLAAGSVLILVITEAWEAQLALHTVFEPLRVPLSAIGYSVRPLIPCLLAMTVVKNTTIRLSILSIPLIANMFISFSSFFCKLAFWYTPENEFVRGPLGLSPFIVAAFYIFILQGLTMINCRKGGLMEALIVSAIAFLAFISTIMESVFGFRAIQNASIATSIIFYYLFLHTNRNNRDTLTGARTRRKFFLDAEKYHSTISAIISIDLNDLKIINDRQGHMAGDKALTTITSVITNCIGRNSALYRIGGDEFMIICYKKTEAEIQSIIERIQTELAKTDYRCAMGYALYTPNADLDHICNAADSAMYENKRQMKQANLNPVTA